MSNEDSSAPDSYCCAPAGSRGVQVQLDADNLRSQVRTDYAKVAQASDAGGGCGVESSCCGVSDDAAINSLISTRLGYSADDLASVPEGADMGLGCGNPRAIAALQPGEVVVDLGSGGGFDCFLAAREVGNGGRVIGVDMTPDMLSKARANAVRGNYANVEFRLGEIEHLPLADNSVDVVISNCVINLSPDKPQVFRDALRILKPGGRLAVSDVVATAELPETMRSDPQLVSGCMGNASLIEDLETMMRDAGFTDIRIAPKDESREFIRDWAPERGVEDYVVSATIEAAKPGGASLGITERLCTSCCAFSRGRNLTQAIDIYGPIPFARPSSVVGEEKGCCHISGLCQGVFRCPRPQWSIRASHPNQSIGLEGPCLKQVNEMPV